MTINIVGDKTVADLQKFFDGRTLSNSDYDRFYNLPSTADVKKMIAGIGVAEDWPDDAPIQIIPELTNGSITYPTDDPIHYNPSDPNNPDFIGINPMFEIVSELEEGIHEIKFNLWTVTNGGNLYTCIHDTIDAERITSEYTGGKTTVGLTQYTIKLSNLPEYGIQTYSASTGLNDMVDGETTLAEHLSSGYLDVFVFSTDTEGRGPCTFNDFSYSFYPSNT